RALADETETALKRAGGVSIESQGVTTPSPDTARSRTNDHMVGHWRFTEVLGGGGGFSLVTDVHLVLDEQGRFKHWSHSASGMGERTTEIGQGSWQTRDNALVLKY